MDSNHLAFLFKIQKTKLSNDQQTVTKYKLKTEGGRILSFYEQLFSY